MENFLNLKGLNKGFKRVLIGYFFLRFCLTLLTSFFLACIIVLWDTYRCDIYIRYGPFIDIKSNIVFCLKEKLWLFSNPIEGYLHVIRIRKGQVTYVTYMMNEGYCFQLLSSQQIQNWTERQTERPERYRQKMNWCQLK